MFVFSRTKYYLCVKKLKGNNGLIDVVAGTDRGSGADC